jgi:threonine/homoserine/homoserine lactone efflux protein
MFGTHDLEIFILSCITLNLIPGNDTIYIITKSLSDGKKAGIISALGISTGVVFHILFAAIGLSALILSFSYAFEIIKILGALYLIYLGISSLLKAKKSLHVKMVSEENSLLKTYKQAVLTNVLNPKVALFFLAFLPQFVDSDAPNKILSFLFLGTIFLTTGTIWCLLLALFASFGANKLKSDNGLFSKIAGMIYIGLGVKLLFEKN